MQNVFRKHSQFSYILIVQLIDYPQHPICDPTEFGSLADLYGISEKEGYLGGLRLLQV